MSVSEQTKARQQISKVAEVTAYFWIIKVLCTTVGETAADFLNMRLGLGLSGTSLVMGILLVVGLFFQYRANRYIPGVYWLTVVLISIFGTLMTDILTDLLRVPLEISTIVFVLALAVTFAIWYGVEKTLSIHSIFTPRRESFYWLAILFTFALGTAAGDLMAESLSMGYLNTGLIICSMIVVISFAWYMGLDSVLSFWIIYIMTRPLGASLGDYMSQTSASGGLGFGPTVTSLIFLSAILATVIFLTLTKRDMIEATNSEPTILTSRKAAFAQVAVVLTIIIALAWTGYHLQRKNLHLATASALPQTTGNPSIPTGSYHPLGDMSSFRAMAEGALELVDSGKLTDAKNRVGDLELAWDNAAGRRKRMNSGKWTEVDSSIDTVLRKLRAWRQDKIKCHASLQSLLAVI
jgi:uncharacterized membrane-anchored protein